MPQNGGKMTIQVVVTGFGDSSGREMVENGRNQVVFGLPRVKINYPKESLARTDVFRPENRENLVGVRIYQQSFGKKLPRNIQNALPGE
jgi:hypothetical protein